MNEEALRALVREAVARHVATAGDTAASPPPVPLPMHVSHFRYALPTSDGPCLIEPTVRCNHCGYCESHGH